MSVDTSMPDTAATPPEDAAESETYYDNFPALPTNEVAKATATNKDTFAAQMGWEGRLVSGKRPGSSTTEVSEIITLPLNATRMSVDALYESLVAGEPKHIMELKKIHKRLPEVTFDMVNSSVTSDAVTLIARGPAAMVAKAKLILAKQFEESEQMTVPRDQHSRMVGKGGKQLHKLQEDTDTVIQMPHRDSTSDTVVISGTKEARMEARRAITELIAQRSRVEVDVARVFHPFLERDVKAFSAPQGQPRANIMIPFRAKLSDTVIVTGEAEAVKAAVEQIEAKNAEYKQNLKTLAVSIKKEQHRWVVGPKHRNIDVIFEKTGVVVEVPGPHEAESSETVTLRGNDTQLIAALQMVMELAKSMACTIIPVDAWKHRRLLGQKGANIQAITQQHKSVNIQFDTAHDKIEVVGPTEECGLVCDMLRAEVAKLAHIHHEAARVPADYVKLLVGKGGANVEKLRQAHQVDIFFPKSGDQGVRDIVSIEGSKEACLAAKKAIEEFVAKVKDTVEDVVPFPMPVRPHFLVEGWKNVKYLREHFPTVRVSLPDKDVEAPIALRGPSHAMQMCKAKIEEILAEIKLNMFTTKVSIYKDFHKNIVGKRGEKRRQLEQLHAVKIGVPEFKDPSEKIVLTGREDKVARCREDLLRIQSDIATIAEDTVRAPPRLMKLIAGEDGLILRHVSRLAGGVAITMPTSKKENQIHIKGPEKGVRFAREELQRLVADNGALLHIASVPLAAACVSQIIGRKGESLMALTVKYNVQVVAPVLGNARPARTQNQGGTPAPAPAPAGSDAEGPRTFFIYGGKADVEVVKAEIAGRAMVIEDTEMVEVPMPVASKSRAMPGEGRVKMLLLRHITDAFVDVRIQPLWKQNMFAVRARKKTLPLVTARLEEYARDCVQITERRLVVQPFYQMLIRRNMDQVGELRKKHACTVWLPKRKTDASTSSGASSVTSHQPPQPPSSSYKKAGAGKPQALHGGGSVVARPVPGEFPVEVVDGDDGTQIAEVPEGNCVVVTGLAGKLDEMIADLFTLFPVEFVVCLPKGLRSNFVGPKGSGIKQLQSQDSRYFHIPKGNEEHVVGWALPGDLDTCRAEVEAKIEALVTEQEIYKEKNFSATVTVDPQYVPILIGKAGANITQIREETNTRIWFKERDTVDKQGNITIIGYEKDVNAAWERMTAIVERETALVTVDFTVDPRVLQELIGFKGKHVKELNKTFDVMITVKRGAGAGGTGTVRGLAEACQQCIERISNEEKDILAHIDEENHMRDLTYAYTNAPKLRPISDIFGSSPHGMAATPTDAVSGPPWEGTALHPARPRHT